MAAKNRTLVRTSGVSQRVGDLGPGLLKYRPQRVRMRRSRGWAKMRIAAVDGRLARTGDVRLVFSKRPRSAWKTVVAFATNETKPAARQIVSIYEKRWAIEVLFKELRGDLGLGDYRVLSKDAIHRHVHLCGLGPLDADPPQHGRCRCTSQEGEDGSAPADDERTPHHPARRDSTRSGS